MYCIHHILPYWHTFPGLCSDWFRFNPVIPLNCSDYWCVHSNHFKECSILNSPTVFAPLLLCFGYFKKMVIFWWSDHIIPFDILPIRKNNRWCVNSIHVPGGVKFHRDHFSSWTADQSWRQYSHSSAHRKSVLHSWSAVSTHKRVFLCMYIYTDMFKPNLVTGFSVVWHS